MTHEVWLGVSFTVRRVQHQLSIFTTQITYVDVTNLLIECEPRPVSRKQKREFLREIWVFQLAFPR